MKTTLEVTNYNDEVIAKYDDFDKVAIENGGVLAVWSKGTDGTSILDYFGASNWNQAHAEEVE